MKLFLTRIRKAQFLFILLLICTVFLVSPEHPPLAMARANSPFANYSFIASVDTMKVSRDIERYPLSQQQVNQIVAAIAQTHTNYVTVDTHFEYPAYMQEWVNAIRAYGLHVWFRSSANQWEDDNGVTGIMSPGQFEIAEWQFIANHPALFRAGDIFDPAPEAENGKYWKAAYGDRWSWQPAAPNAATHAFNIFLRDTTTIANQAFSSKGIYGVITNIRSLNPFFFTHTGEMEDATINMLNYVTIDSYPEGNTVNPSLAAAERWQELIAIENIWHRPIIIGEMGYSNNFPVDDHTQQAVLAAEFNVIASQPYVVGANYWVGPGSNTAGGFTNIFQKVNSTWIARPAAYSLAAFYQYERGV
jgi:hypothetical protein